MLKEMNEQPKTIRDTISPRIKDGRIVIDELGMSDEEIRISAEFTLLPAVLLIIPDLPVSIFSREWQEFR